MCLPYLAVQVNTQLHEHWLGNINHSDLQVLVNNSLGSSMQHTIDNPVFINA